MTHDTALDLGDLEAALIALGDVLTQRGISYDVVLIGGANLLLRGIITRSTKDADLLGELLDESRVMTLRELPPPLKRAAEDVADAYGLAPNWFNSAPTSLVDDGLPAGFVDRLQRRTFGGLGIWLAGEFDMVCFKLYAASDHWPRPGRHIDDLRALKPSESDLFAAGRWCLGLDTSPGFRTMLVDVLGDLGLEDADDRLG